MQKLSPVRRVIYVVLAMIFAVVAEYQNSLQWYLFQSGLFCPPQQLEGVDIDMQRGWLRTKWDSDSMYFQKVDIFGSDRIVGAFLITDDPKGVQHLVESQAYTTAKKYTWGEVLWKENGMAANNQPEPNKTQPPSTPMLVPSLGIRIATSQPELLNEVVQLKRKP